jgi:hypothetical protein
MPRSRSHGKLPLDGCGFLRYVRELRWQGLENHLARTYFLPQTRNRAAKSEATEV